MNIPSVGAYGAVSQSVRVPQKTTCAVPGAESGTPSAKTDTAEISGGAACFARLQEQFPQMSFSVGSGFSGKNARNTGDNANPYALTIHPRLLEKMSADPEAEAEYTQRIRDIGRAISLVDGITKAWGMKTVYCENYVDENRQYYHVSVSVRKDALNEKLREEARAFIERMRENNCEAAEKLEAKLSQADETGKLELDSDDMRNISATIKLLERSDNSASAEEAEETESESVGGSVGINAAKLARKLAAAKTQSQIRAIIAEIQSDLKECENGVAQGMDVDEASVEAAERLLQEARQRMGQAESREATPEEEMASMLASLF